MKYWLSFLALGLFLLVGCGGNEASTPPPPPVPDPVVTVDESTQFPAEIDSTTQIAWEKKKVPTANEGRWNCTDFLKGYENWVDYYVQAIQRQASNPLDTDNLSKMAKLAMQTTKWVAEGLKCNANEAYRQAWERATEKLSQWRKSD